MSIAEKILRAKEDYDAVYDAGYAAGVKVGGPEEEIEMDNIGNYYCFTEHNGTYPYPEESSVYSCYYTAETLTPGETYKVICNPMNPENLWQNFLFSETRDHPLCLAVPVNDESVGQYVTKVNDTTYLITIPENCEQIHINCTIADGCKMYLANGYVVGYNEGYIAGANANGGTTVSIISYVGAISGHMRSDFEVGENITDADVTNDDYSYAVYKYSFNKAVYGGKLTIEGIVHDSFQDVAHHAVLLLCDGKVAISQDDIDISPDVDSHLEGTYILTLPDDTAVDCIYINDFPNSGEHILTYSGDQKTEYDAFWDTFQGGGERYAYGYAFIGLYDSMRLYGWNDEIYNPKYPILLGNETHTQTTFGQQVYYYNTNITDTKVDILVYVDELKNTFVNAYDLKTIRKLKLMKENIVFTTPFANCRALENITFEGVIGSSIDLQYSTKLSKASIESIISCLSISTSGLSVTLSRAAIDTAFETSSGAADGSTSTEWIELTDTVKSWTISLV